MNPIITIFLIILLIVIIYLLHSNPTSKSTESMSVGIIPNCNMLNDENTCNKTNGCYYTPIGCLYDWKNI